MVKSSSKRKRILLVEDQEDAREIAAFNLEEYTLTCARDFDEGLRSAQRRYFDLYILDNRLPDGSGIELCRIIREFDPHTPILLYSVAGYARDIREALRAGAQECLVKPVRIDELKRAVVRLLSVALGTAFEARQAEVAAIREEMAIRQMENASRVEKSKDKRLRAEEKALRVKAQIAYLAAGGTRGEFAREWPSVFLEEVRGARTSAAVSGN